MAAQFLFKVVSSYALLVSATPITSSIAAAPPGASMAQPPIFAGSGCAGDTDASWSGGVDSLTLVYPVLSGKTGPGISISDSRHNCQFVFDIAYPDNYQYSVSSVSYAGAASLDAGGTATPSGLSYFSGGTPQITWSTTLTGPYNGGYSAVYTPSAADTVWSPCGGGDSLLDVNSVALANRNAQVAGSVTVSNATVSLQWRTC
ncbi:hypothetical protein BT63DRAFT_458261 [Microthyrium microscopicum]|uniref:DUF4360 domain-containing protein n=1 Tax=Microthyrium microscopicum TaxID=703497 RepID=A0A6A6U394_9PEZI|nr:hypothetical protein BT63DRAFT_458261 [Microthyrium microscopicum]